MKILKTSNYEYMEQKKLSTICFDKDNNPVPQKVNSSAMMIFDLMRDQKISKADAFEKIITTKDNDEFINSVNTRLEEILTYY